MKQIAVLVLFISLVFSCSSDNEKFSGNWIERKYENESIRIEKNGSNYVVEIDNRRYPAQIKSGLLEISTDLPKKAIIDKNDNLILGGIEYVRYENTNKPKFNGIWSCEKEDSELPMVCSVLNFDLMIQIVDNEIKFSGGNYYEKNFQTYNDIRFQSISYLNDKIIAKYRYFWNPRGGPMLEINGSYYENYHFKGRLEISIIDNNTILIKQIDNQFGCQPVIYKKQE